MNQTTRQRKAPQRRELKKGCRAQQHPPISANPTGFLMNLLVMNTAVMNVLVFASATGPKGLPVILPALAGAGLLAVLSQLFVPKQS